MGRRNNARTKNRNYRRKMRAYNTRSRLFNGNVYFPGEFIAIWVIILAFIVGLWIMCLNTGLHKSDYVRTNLVYEGSCRKKDRIVLTLSGKEYKAWASLCDLEGINKLKEGESLSVITAEDDLVCIRYDNTELLPRVHGAPRCRGKAPNFDTFRDNGGVLAGLCGGLGLCYVQRAEVSEADKVVCKAELPYKNAEKINGG